MRISALFPGVKPISQFLLVSLMVISSSCSTDSEDDNISGKTSEMLVQFSEKSVFDNELSGRVIAPDFQFSFFSDTGINGNYIKSILYSSGTTQLVIYRGEGESRNRSLVFPIANNVVSPFGYEFTVNAGEVTRLNLVEKTSSSDGYTVLYTLYTTSASEADSYVKSPTSPLKSSRTEEKTLGEQLTETIKDLAPAFEFFDTSLVDLLEKINDLPEAIDEKMGEWKQELVNLTEETKKMVTDLVETEENLDTATEEPLEPEFNDEESIVQEETSSLEIEPWYPDNGIYIGSTFYPLSQAFVDYHCYGENGCTEEDLNYDAFWHELEIASEDHEIGNEDGVPYLSEAEFALQFTFASKSSYSIENGTYTFSPSPDTKYTFYGNFLYNIENDWETYSEIGIRGGTIEVTTEGGQTLLILNNIQLENGEILKGRFKGKFMVADI